MSEPWHNSNCVSPRKRRRICGVTAHRLLDLPDDALTHILRLLCGLRPNTSTVDFPVLHGSGLERAADAFAFAQTCSRLMHLFTESCLKRIDVRVPDADYGAVQGSHSRCAREVFNLHQQPMHVKSMARMAGGNLRELHLPKYGDKSGLESLLDTLASHCYNLNILSFNELDLDPMFPYELPVRKIGQSLRKLQLSSPSLGILQRLRHSDSLALRVVELNDVDPCKARSLVAFLRAQGKNLEDLKIVFRALFEFAGSGGKRIRRVQSMRKFTSLIGTRLLAWCPQLHSLGIGIRQNENVCPMSLNHTVRRFVEEIATLCNLLLEQEPVFGDNSLRLRRLVVLAGNDEISTVSYLHALVPLIGPSTHVEALIPGVAVVLPTAGSARSKSYFRAFVAESPACISKSLQENKSAFDKVEDLTIFADHVMPWGLDPLRFLCSRAKWSLKTICANNRALMDRSHLGFLSHLMRHAPRVTSLVVSRELICFSSGNAEVLGSIMATLRRIRLLSEESYSPIPCTIINAALVTALPEFLSIVRTKCPLLEAIHLRQVNDGSLDSGSDDILIPLQRAFCAVEDFEKARPMVDLSTVKRQISMWLRTCIVPLESST